MLLVSSGGKEKSTWIKKVELELYNLGLVPPTGIRTEHYEMPQLQLTEIVVYT